MPMASGVARVAIIGLGLIGSSIARAVREETHDLVRVTRVDRPDALMLAPDQADQDAFGMAQGVFNIGIDRQGMLQRDQISQPHRR